MPIITDIKPQVKDKQRINLYLDGMFYCGLNVLSVAKAGLKIGKEIERHQIEELQLNSEKMTALDKATAYITRAKKTQKELTDYLVKKGYLDSVINFVIEKMQYYNYLNDSEYAAAYVRTYMNRYGEHKLRFNLKNKGVSDDDIKQAFNEITYSCDIVFLVAEKYMKAKEKDRKNKDKLFRHLAAKGFNYDDIKKAIDKIYYGEDDDL